MKVPVDIHPNFKLRLHMIIGSLVLLTFCLIIARLAVKGTPSSRTNTWGIAVCVKAALFLTYQVVTAHAQRFKRWASIKANKILNIIDTIFWFALFIITIMGTSGAHSMSSRALGGIIATLSFFLCGIVGFLAFICIRESKELRVAHSPI